MLHRFVPAAMKTAFRLSEYGELRFLPEKDMEQLTEKGDRMAGGK
jgi:hypothetical protein